MMIDENAAVTLLEKRPEKIFRLWTGFGPTSVAISLKFFQAIFPVVLWLHSHLSFFHLIATVGHLLPWNTEFKTRVQKPFPLSWDQNGQNRYLLLPKWLKKPHPLVLHIHCTYMYMAHISESPPPPSPWSTRKETSRLIFFSAHLVRRFVSELDICI